MQRASTKTCFYYFNGTAFPVATFPYVDCSGIAHKQLTAHVRAGFSLTEIGDCLMETMVAWEKLMVEAMEGKVYTKKNIKKWVKMVNEYRKQIRTDISKEYHGVSLHRDMTLEVIHATWIYNVHILLKLKRIKNDNNNGLMFLDGNAIPHLCTKY